MEENEYQVVISSPAKLRYQRDILPYIFTHFSFDRASEIDEYFIEKAASLKVKPRRGTKEKFLQRLPQEFRFILVKITRHFELKIVYFIEETTKTVYITDFFPTKMDTTRMGEDY